MPSKSGAGKKKTWLTLVSKHVDRFKCGLARMVPSLA